MKTKIKFRQIPRCTRCREAKVFLEDVGAELGLHSLNTPRLSETEIDKLIGNRDYKKFLNTRNERYRTPNMSVKPPYRAEAIKLMAKEPNLMRRPAVIRREQIVLGYDQEAFRKLVKKRD